MSKAEEAALKAYPEELTTAYGPLPGASAPCIFDGNLPYRIGFKRGYETAEKDLGWISVKDRLPNTTEYVFTCIKMDGKPQCVGFHYYKDGKWWEGYEEDSVGAVEYWMQIPQFKEAKQ